MAKYKLLIAVVAVFVLAFCLPQAVCAKSVMFVPAVDTSGKGIITTMEASVQSGSGAVYVDTEPFVSVETQQSAQLAAKIAAKKAGVDLSKYDVLYKIVADAEVVDGPSGGAALTLLAYAEFTGKKIRSDIAVTGSIEQDGSIGKIGGVLQKAEAVKNAGLKVFAVPLGQAVQQGIDLTVMGERWGVQVVEAANFDEEVKIAFSPAGSKVNVSTRVLPPLSLNPVNASLGIEMRALAESELKELEGLEKQLAATDGEEARTVLNTVRDSLNSSDYLLEKGYWYSAANNAFVAKTGVNAFLLSNVSKKDLAKMIQDLEKQFNEPFEKKFSAAFKKKTLQNWEWVAAAQARFNWGRARVKELGEKIGLTTDPMTLLEDYSSAVSWLEAAGKMSETAGSMEDAAGASGGQAKEVNEFNVRPLAQEFLDEANKSVAVSFDSEAVWHLGVARDAFAEGSYASSLIDSCFALGFSRAQDEALKAFGEDFNALLEGESSINDYKSVWAQLYFVHSLYSAVEGNRSNDFSYSFNALKLQELAKCLNMAVLRAEPLLASNASAGAAVASPQASAGGEELGVQAIITTQPARFDLKYFVLFSVFGLIILVGIAVLFVRGKVREREKPLSSGERLERLDDLLLKGRISERNYEVLRKRYSDSSSGKKSTNQPARAKQPRLRLRPR